VITPVTQRGEAVIIGHHQRSGDGVTPTVAGDVALVSPVEIMRLLAAAVEMHRSVKAQSTGLSDEQLRELLSESLGAADLRPKAVADRLTKRKVADMPKA
jgi:hypothetical protein